MKSEETTNSKASGEGQEHSLEVQLSKKNYKELVHACQEITLVRKESMPDSMRIEDFSSHSLKDSSFDQA